MEWVNRIQRALAEDRFCLFAQPVCLTRGDRAARPYTELLLRLRDEESALILPSEFIPAAERYNLMPAIDRWVVRTAFSKLAQLRDVGQTRPGDMCAINISGASLGDEKVLEFVREQFAQFGIAHSSICFEITETAAISVIAKAAQFMHELRKLGCKFSLDDFGAGMSSFAYLKHLPVDFLKIDGSFVKDMATDPIDAAMVEAINRIGHVMGKLTIAEFVENQDVLAALRRIGVDYAQGYGIAKPALFHSSHNVMPFPVKPMLKRA
jgi:EAL domain-containing protein (putative c-di-GMP-specific phosphodiesterase class I)